MEGHKAVSPIIMPSLVDFVGRNEPEACLCPVRALRVYMTRTKAFRGTRNRFSFQGQCAARKLSESRYVVNADHISQVLSV